MALAFSSLATWAYLRGRQQSEPRMLAVAALGCLAAALCADVALANCAWLAGLEFVSARRHRKSWTRARSALAVAAVAALLAAVTWIARRALLGQTEIVPIAWTALPASGEQLVAAGARWLARLGALIVPVNAGVAGTAGFFVAGAVALAALQPTLVAARSAPRLWGTIVVAWAIGMATSESFATRAYVDPWQLDLAWTLLGSTAVMCVGLGLCAVSLSGARRALVPLAMAVGLGVLSHSHALALRDAGAATQAVAHVVSDVEASDVFVIDPPLSVQGVAALQSSERAFGAQVEFATEREFLLAAALGALDPSRAAGRLAVVRRIDGEWSTTRFSAGEPETGARAWFREGRSPELDLDPWSTRAFVVRSAADADTSRPPVMAWSSPASGVREAGRAVGRWTSTGAGAEAVFDLSGELAWLATERVRQAWSVEGWSLMGQAEFLAALPAPPVEASPAIAGDTWRFGALEGALIDGGDARRAWRMRGRASLAGVLPELTATLDGAALAVDASAWRAVLDRGEALEFALETTIDGAAIERLVGRAAR
jgi:hypothetical protein